MNQRYRDRTVVVTGSAGGLGRALALGYAAEGARTVLVDIGADGLAETEALIAAAGGKAVSHVADLSDEQAIVSLATAIMTGHPRVHLLFNNAGVAYGEINGPVDSAGLAAWTRFLTINSLSPLLLARALRPALAAARGAIINQSSMASFSPGSIYGVTKSMLNALTFGMASAFGRDGIRVNAIAPGLMETPASAASLSAETKQRIGGMQMIDAQGEPEDIVRLGLFLGSDEARFITGEIISCDAGNRVRGWRY